MAEHTPGPWEIIVDGTLSARWPRIAVPDASWDGEYRELAELEAIELGAGLDGESWEDKPNRAEVEANARLIAAAPDLLLACDMLIRDSMARPGAYIHARNLDAIRAAIAKARNG